ncbi:hypothetical protein AHAS_Ahas13G0303100 [Arachis hypogaea]
MAANPEAEGDTRKVIGSYTASNSDFYGCSISIPAIGTNKFELKPQLVTLVQQNYQFHGLPQDPNKFIFDFLQICDTVKTNGVNPEVYKLILFPFAVRDRARLWLDSQPKKSLDTWEKVVNRFLTKFFPPQKLSKLRVEVQTFRQKEGESLYEAWERYKQLIRRCPLDMILDWTILDIFYDGLSEASKMSLDHSAGGSLHFKKMPKEAQELIDMVANNQYMYTSDRNPVNNGATQKSGVLEVDTLDAILAQNKLMSQQINMISQHLSGTQSLDAYCPEIVYEIDASDNAWTIMEEVNYMGKSSRTSNNNPYSNTFNQGWRNHPNFGWRDQ